MTNILLIRTSIPSENKVTQPLGVMYIASSLLKDPGNNVKILDFKLKPLPFYELRKEIENYRPDILGFSVLPLEAPWFKVLTKEVKKIFPHISIVAGGVYPTVLTDDVFKDSSVDFAVIGEGEEIMRELAKALGKNGKALTLPGTAFLKDGDLVINDRERYIENLDKLPMPAWDLVPLNKYFDIPRTFPIYKNKEYMSIFTSRACPFKCNFCHSIFGKNYRARSPENVFSEIETLYNNHGIKEIHIVDDCFNFDINRAKKICDLIIQSNIEISITFPNGIRGDLVDNELLLKFKKAGVYAICYGVQSGSKRLQIESGSNIKLDKLSKVVEATNENGIIAYGYCMIGFPGETKEDLYMTLNYVKKNKFLGATFYFTTPYPGTDLFKSLKEDTKLTTNENNFLRDYRFSPSGINDFSIEELRRFQLFANISFYFNINKLFRLIYLLPNKWILIEIIKVYLIRIATHWKRTNRKG